MREEGRPESADLLVSQAVGAFLLPMVFLVVELILWDKASSEDDSESLRLSCNLVQASAGCAAESAAPCSRPILVPRIGGARII